jgi:hypothetical protein
MKHVMGVIGVLLAMWGIGSVYNAVVDIEWLQGAFGVACLGGAIAIYRIWFRERRR